MLCAKIDWNWLSCSGEENFFNFVNVYSLFRNYLPLEKGGALHLNKLESPSPKDDLCQVWLKLAQWFCRRRFLNFVNVFSLFRNYLPFWKGGTLFWTKLNPHHSLILCAKIGWNWLSGSGEEDFFNFVNVISTFHYYLPLEKGGALHLNKVESPWHRDALCQVWLKMAQWFWKRQFVNFVNVFSQFHKYLPFEKGGALHLNQIKSPSPWDILCQVWLKLAQWFWRRKYFNFVNVISLFRHYLSFEKGGALHLNKL